MTGTFADVPACWSWPVPDFVDAESVELWATVVAWQAGRCALCGQSSRALEKDHDHRTGLRRGLLCKSCNNHEGSCARTPCGCDGYRVKHPAAILGVSVRHGGWFEQSPPEPTPDDVARRVAKIKNRRKSIDPPADDMGDVCRHCEQEPATMVATHLARQEPPARLCRTCIGGAVANAVDRGHTVMVGPASPVHILANVYRGTK